MTIYAYTGPGHDYPDVINISERVGDPRDVIVTVRTAGERASSSIILDRAKAVALAQDILGHYSAPTPAIKAAVDRFLGWSLPKTFSPDCGISFDGRKDDEWNKNKSWPIGTNLLSSEEARAMFEYALQGSAPLAERPALGAAFPGYSAMQPHQQRVVNEAAELDDRLAKLLAFFDTPTFAALDTAERDRLHTQAGAMVAYSDALESRINAFAPAAKRPLSADLPGSVIDQIGH